MNMVWVTILTLVVGSPAGPAVGRTTSTGCLAVESRDRVQPPVPVCSRSLARRVDGRPSVPPWSSPLIEEFDTREVDETWIVHLDAVTSIPIAWLSWARPISATEPSLVDRLNATTILAIPLRC